MSIWKPFETTMQAPVPNSKPVPEDSIREIAVPPASQIPCTDTVNTIAYGRVALQTAVLGFSKESEAVIRPLA
jgi:hypothetical protein